MVIENALVYINKKRTFERCDVRIMDGVIDFVGRYNGDDDERVDATDYVLIPGLVDVHTHGRIGIDFTDCSPEELHDVARSYAQKGVTTVMPSLASAPFENMRCAVKNISEFVPNDEEANFCGVHFEGRYLNPKKRGAHAESLLAPLDAYELEDEVFRMCRRLHISAAYELDTDGSFMAKVKEIGATMGLAHTTATYGEAKTAEERGIISYTHLFNAMTPLHHRDGGAVCAAFEGDRFAEIICDGFHISPEMIRLTHRLKGIGRMTLISDSIAAAGCPDGDYDSPTDPYYVKDGHAYTYSSGAIAGSTASLDEEVNNLIEFCNIPLGDAIITATENPARQVGVFDECGSIEVGKRADMLFCRGTERLCIERVMVRGEFI
ncbi:MAG: N-acetylglucosamine-6-phosphate deacetylase [Clostridia bacterium]|nr:N-acetylglucosamine-6-phosphate deacetylase [Clostridia bacterium]